MRITALILLPTFLCGVSALAAPTTTAFNLACSGTITSDSIYERNKTEPYAYTYRIDLAKNKFCESDCTAIDDIYKVQPGFIQLRAPVNKDTIDDKRFSDGTIDRQTGHQQILMESGRDAGILIMKWDGQCVKQPFTGFPDVKTKF